MTLAEQLADAELKYHSLATGRLARAVVDQNGERVEYTMTSRAALYAYILALRALIAGGGVPVPGGPIGFYF